MTDAQLLGILRDVRRAAEDCCEDITKLAYLTDPRLIALASGAAVMSRRFG